MDGREKSRTEMLGMGGEIGQCVYVCVLCGYMFPIKKLLDLPQ